MLTLKKLFVSSAKNLFKGENSSTHALKFVPKILYLYLKNNKASDMTQVRELYNFCMDILKHYGHDKTINMSLKDLEPMNLGCTAKQISRQLITREGPDEKLFDYKKDIDFRGLKNLGNTCYMNVIIQTLFMTIDFRQQLIRLFFKENLNYNEEDMMDQKFIQRPGVNKKVQMTCLFQLSKLFANLNSSFSDHCNPTEFRQRLPE